MKYIHAHRFLLPVSLCAALIACTPVKHTATSPNTLASANDYLNLAATATGHDQQHYRLLAAQRFLAEKNTQQANALLNSLADNTLTPRLKIEKTLTQAELSLDNHDNDRALRLLNTVAARNTPLQPADTLTLHTLLARTYQARHNILSALKERDATYNRLPAADQPNYLLMTWAFLQHIDRRQREALLGATLTPQQQGWLTLSLLNTPDTRADALEKQLNQWQVEHPDHPANALIDTIKKSKQAFRHLPTHIALLLPLTGPLKKQAAAIRNGFFAAYYQAKNKGVVPTITVYNTDHHDITTVYNEAIDNGARFIVGPLTKPNLQTLITHHALRVPTLALNELDNPHPINGLYQFGLSPIDETQQVASRLWESQAKRIAIIAPNDDWNGHIVDAFQRTWTEQGGTILTQIRYRHTGAHLSQSIRALLNIDQSEQRHRTLRAVLRETFRGVLRRRHDIDAIFLLATPRMGRAMMPLLRFYYAANLPVYSLSQLYTGTQPSKLDHDLNGLRFVSMPWLLTPTTPAQRTLKKMLRTLWPHAFRKNARFFALGIDGYNLIPDLGQLTVLPQFGVDGTTGTLFLLPNQHIHRQLTWATIQHGQPQLLPE